MRTCASGRGLRGHNIDCFILLFGRTAFPLRGKKLCYTIPFFPLYPEDGGMDQYSAGGFQYGPWVFGVNHLAAVKWWEARSWSQKRRIYNRRVMSNLTFYVVCMFFLL